MKLVCILPNDIDYVKWRISEEKATTFEKVEVGKLFILDNKLMVKLTDIVDTDNEGKANAMIIDFGYVLRVPNNAIVDVASIFVE